jgi:hypothetical protein
MRLAPLCHTCPHIRWVLAGPSRPPSAGDVDHAAFEDGLSAETLSAKDGALTCTDVLADGLSREELAQWVSRIYKIGDAEPPPENVVVTREARPRRTVPPPLPMASWTPTAPPPEESTWSDLPALGARGEEILSVLDDEIVSSTSENSDGDKATAMSRYDEDEQTTV